MLGPDGRIGHVEVELGDAVIMLLDRQPDWPATPAHLRVYVASTRDTFDRALAAGARAVTRPTDLAFGELAKQPTSVCATLKRPTPSPTPDVATFDQPRRSGAIRDQNSSTRPRPWPGQSHTR